LSYERGCRSSLWHSRRAWCRGTARPVTEVLIRPAQCPLRDEEPPDCPVVSRQSGRCLSSSSRRGCLPTLMVSTLLIFARSAPKPDGTGCRTRRACLPWLSVSNRDSLRLTVRSGTQRAGRRGIYVLPAEPALSFPGWRQNVVVCF